jgi:hypothetical protein
MRKILALFLILLLSGCFQVPSPEDLKEGAKEIIKDRLGQEIGVAGFDMKEGDTVTVDNKVVRLVSFSPDYVVVFDIDGQEREMRETQDPQIVNGIELTIKGWKFDASNLAGNYVKADIKKYIPGEDEYLFYLDDMKAILGHEIKLSKLDKDGSVSFMVDSVNDIRVREDMQEGVLDIYISNIRPNFRAIASERYVIVRVEKKP